MRRFKPMSASPPLRLPIAGVRTLTLVVLSRVKRRVQAAGVWADMESARTTGGATRWTALGQISLDTPLVRGHSRGNPCRSKAVNDRVDRAFQPVHARLFSVVLSQHPASVKAGCPAAPISVSGSLEAPRPLYRFDTIHLLVSPCAAGWRRVMWPLAEGKHIGGGKAPARCSRSRLPLSVSPFRNRNGWRGAYQAFPMHWIRR